MKIENCDHATLPEKCQWAEYAVPAEARALAGALVSARISILSPP
jgi:hypothetical protein